MKKVLSLLIIMSLIFSVSPVSMVLAEETLLFYSFETEDEGWSAWSSAGKYLNTFPQDCATHGKKSLLINDNSEGLAGGIATDKVEIKEGVTYSASADVLLVYGTINVALRYYDKDDKRLTNVTKKTTIGKWENAVITEVAPAGAKYANIVIATNAATKSIGYFDNVKLIEGKVEAKTPNGTVPAKLPELTEDTSIVKPTDDGVPDGAELICESFENGLSDWTYATANSKDYVEFVSDEASDGQKSVYINDVGDITGPGLKSPFIKVSQGNTYTVLADFKGISGTIKVYVKFFNQEGTTLIQNSGNMPIGSWQEFLTYVDAPKDAVSMQVTVCGIVATEGKGYVDNIRVYKGKKKVTIKDASFIPPKQSSEVPAKIVAPVNDKLQYMEYNEKGDKIGDFSYAGFYKGEYELPDSNNLPVVMEISPTGTSDDTKMIQDAIDKVYSDATDDSMKILRLKAGTYYINKDGIKLKSGIVLQGEGQGPTGTILYAKDNVQHSVVKIEGKAPVVQGEIAYITDDYVKAGSNVINVSENDAKNFKAGDTIVIYHPSNQKWAEAIEMFNITNNSNVDTSWGEKKVDMMTERTITSVKGTEITLDFGVFVPYMKDLTNSYIYKIDETNKIHNVGIENLRISSYYNGENDEKHAYILINIAYAKDVFIRNVTGMHFVKAFVSSGKRAKQITVLNCSAIKPVSTVAGGRRYNFACETSAQQLLYTACYSSEGRHDFETSAPVTGPISYVDNVVDQSTAGTETHGTWSTGVLFDNIYNVSNDTKGTIGFKNHGIYGSVASQGWTAAGTLAWNCLSPTIIGHKPLLTYQNFIVGTWGIYTDPAAVQMKKDNIDRYTPIYKTSKQEKFQPENFATNEGTPVVGDCYKEAEYTPVNPRSLYKAQLAERFTGSIKNARPNAPIIINPKYDKEYVDGNVSVSGISQLGATAVSVYIDDIKYSATISSDNSFEFTKTLGNGVHKIYATQTIDGVEGVKTADRFIIIGNPDGNPSYLQSIYSPQKTRMIINDTRPSYDVVSKEESQANKDKIKVIVNSAKLVSDVEPYETNGRVLVPMRAIFEALKAEVSWDEATLTATAIKEGTEVKITENQTTAYVNSNPITLDVPATILNGRFVVPVRFISESFGADVSWIDSKKTVVIGNVAFPASHGISNELDICKAIQSGDDGAGAIIDNIFDNDYTTKWGVAFDESNPEGAFGIFDLGSSYNISSMNISFTSGNVRKYNIDLYVSEDGINYTPVITGYQSSGTTTDFEEIVLNCKGRYLKIVGKGNSVNKWMNIQELAIIKGK